ncbi:MAG: endonuclease/exonuclease/phosphatase family protein [Verrucomicrobiales bacterium]|nr:endonuclease/exonuclease/phosphatase family protein [Verrucomicrobiales bacterium]
MRIESMVVSIHQQPAKLFFAGFFVLLLCSLLGAIFLFSSSLKAQERQEKNSDEGDTGELRFLSYNLRNYLPMKRRVKGVSVEDAPKPDDEIAALIKVVVSSKPDVVGVCEIGGMGYLKDFQSRLKSEGLDLPYIELVQASTEYERNLALLSRFPIVARNPQTELTYLIGQQRLPFQRGILDVTIAPNSNYRLRLVGLHLKSKRETPEADQALMRQNEALLARRHVDGILQQEPGVNLIVYGDLNATKNEMPVRTLRGRFRTDTYLKSINMSDQYGFLWTHYWNYADSYARFDFVLASKGVLAEIDKKKSYIPHGEDWYLASDHRPLLLVLESRDQ